MRWSVEMEMEAEDATLWPGAKQKVAFGALTCWQPAYAGESAFEASRKIYKNICKTEIKVINLVFIYFWQRFTLTFI